MLALFATPAARSPAAMPARPAIASARRHDPCEPGRGSSPPIECWWKTDRSAVRVGERFHADDDVRRARHRTGQGRRRRVGARAVGAPSGSVRDRRRRALPRHPERPRRFFQYQYAMRVLGEEFFGKEITLPRLQISYRVQNSLQGGSALQGREAQYSLVPVPIRVLSLVPAGTADIRDTPVDTFGDVDARLFRSNLLLILAACRVRAGRADGGDAGRAAGGEAACDGRRREQRPMSPGAVLRAASRELGAVQSASQSGGLERRACRARSGGAAPCGRRGAVASRHS